MAEVAPLCGSSGVLPLQQVRVSIYIFIYLSRHFKICIFNRGGLSCAIDILLFSLSNISEKLRMATHPSSLAWRISWTEEPGGLQSMG